MRSFEEIDRLNSLEYFFSKGLDCKVGEKFCSNDIKKSLRKEIFTLNRQMNLQLHSMKKLSEDIGYSPDRSLSKEVEKSIRTPFVYSDKVIFEKGDVSINPNKYNNLVLSFLMNVQKEQRLSEIEKSIPESTLIILPDNLSKKIF